MQFLKITTVAASVLALSGLVACGGGGSDGDTPNRFGQGVAAPANTLVLTTSTSTSFPTGSYTLDTGYTNASGLVNINGHVIEWVWPENLAFDSGVFFSQTDPRKFAVSLYDQAPDTAYRCVSSTWTTQELAELALVFDDPSLPGVQKCPSGMTIDAPGHHISFSDWTLASDDGTKSVKLSVNVSWLLQNGTLSTGSGSGSGSTSSGSVISSGGSISLPSGSLGISIREASATLALPEQPDLSAIERELEISNSR